MIFNTLAARAFLLSTLFRTQTVTQAELVSFFSPVEASAPAYKWALPWALMRTHYPRAPLYAYVNGNNATNIVKLRKLCSLLTHCHLKWFTKRDIYAFQHGDQFIHVNGAQGFDDLFAMYRNASQQSLSPLVMLLQPDCLVRGRVPLNVWSDCLSHASAAACGHFNAVNVLEDNVKPFIPERNTGDMPTHYTFTCGVTWKKQYAQRVFSQENSEKIKKTPCVYDDTCISMAIYMEKLDIHFSQHVTDWRLSELDNISPILHDDKRHYKKGWLQLPHNAVPLYDNIRRHFV